MWRSCTSNLKKFKMVIIILSGRPIQIVILIYLVLLLLLFINSDVADEDNADFGFNRFAGTARNFPPTPDELLDDAVVDEEAALPC